MYSHFKCLFVVWGPLYFFLPIHPAHETDSIKGSKVLVIKIFLTAAAGQELKIPDANIEFSTGFNLYLSPLTLC